jgi:ABC-type multidrug transport system fused ATPase/permease subunit
MKDYVEHQVKSKAEKFFRGFFKVVFMIIAAIAFLLLFGYGFMLLWNWLMPDVFGLPILTYWKAVGILVMAKILFGSFGDMDSKKGPKKQKKKFRERIGTKCGSDFSKWEFYDEFWKQEGEDAFNEFVRRKDQNDAIE